MSRIRLVLVSLLAVLAVSAVASASAWATPKFILKSGSLPASADGTSGMSTLTAEILGVKIEITCKKDTIKTTLEASGKSSAGSISFKECHLATAEKKCKLSSAEETEMPTTFNEDQLEEIGGRIIDRFEPTGATNTLATIMIEKVSGQTCVIEGSYSVKGSQYCEIDKSNTEAEEGKEKHELICKASGSELYLGSPTNKVSFTSTATLGLTSGGKWRIASSCSSIGEPVWTIGGKPLCAGETHTAVGTVAPIKIFHDEVEGQEVVAQCERFTFTQEFKGGEPGTAVMAPESIEGVCEVEKPSRECIVEIRRGTENEQWDAKLELIGGAIWQTTPEVILPLKYNWAVGNPAGCPKGKESDGHLEFKAEIGEPALSFSGEAVGAES